MTTTLNDLKFPGIETENVDSMSACLTAAANYWKREFDYTFMAGLTGSAFSPAWNVGGDCVAWWMESGLPERLDFVGKTVGFFVNESPDMSREEYESHGGVSDEIIKFRELARDAVNGGEIVLVWSWPLWGIIKKWDDDVEKIELATVPCPASSLARVRCLSKMYILNPGPPELIIYDALIEAIKFAPSVASGDIDTVQYKYGGSLYQAMIDKLKDDPYCGSCGEKSWSCVLRTMARIRGLNRTCVEFLEFAGEFLGELLPKNDLELAINNYKTISEIAGKYVDSELLRDNWDTDEFKAGYKSDVEKMLKFHKGCATALGILASGL